MRACSEPVWKVCAALPIACWGQTVGALEPAPEVTLIGKTQIHGHCGGRVTTSQSTPRLGQPQLHQVGMWRQPESRLERAVEAETIYPGQIGEICQAHVIGQVGVEVVPSQSRHLRHSRISLRALAPVHLASQLAQ